MMVSRRCITRVILLAVAAISLLLMVVGPVLRQVSHELNLAQDEPTAMAPLPTPEPEILAPLDKEVYRLSMSSDCSEHTKPYNRTRIGLPQRLQDMMASATQVRGKDLPAESGKPGRLEDHPLGMIHDNMVPFDDLMKAGWMGGLGNGLIVIPITSSYVELLRNLLKSLQKIKVKLWSEVVVVPLDRLAMEACRSQFGWHAVPGENEFSVHCSNDTIKERPPPPKKRDRRHTGGDGEVDEAADLLALEVKEAGLEVGEDREAAPGGPEDGIEIVEGSNDTPCCSSEWAGYIWFKTELVLRALLLNRSILLSDVDVVYFNEHPLLRLVTSNNPILNWSRPTRGTFLASLSLTKSGYNFNIGVLFVRPSKETVSFFAQMLTYRKSRVMQQETYNCFIEDARTKGLVLEPLVRALNPFCKPTMNAKSAKYIRSIHFSCLYPGGPAEKKKAMMDHNCWLL